jgi:glycosyltransferase involved in cell wall biosynthesis
MPAMQHRPNQDKAAEPAIRTLVITTTFPPTGADFVHGIYQRLRLFMGALNELSTQIDILNVIPEAMVVLYPDLELLQREVSDYWGRPVSVTLIPQRTRKNTFRTHYLSGILRASEQPQIQSFTGPEQVAAIGRHLDLNPDIVFVQRLEAMCAVLRARRPLRNVYFDIDDINHRARLRWICQPPFRVGKLGYLAQLPALVCAERQGAALSRLTFVCSEGDRRHLRRLGFGRNVVVVPNAVALPATLSALPSEPTVMFIGSFDYPPNVEAAVRLVYRIMPLVRQRVPDATLLLAGKGSEELPSARADVPGVEHLGFVPNLDSLYARSKVICCPISNGGGTRVKLIEGAAQARPMVATRVGAEGLDFIDGEEILLRDDDEALAAACVQLLQDDALCLRLGEAARRKAVRLYDGHNIQKEVVRLMRERIAERKQ